MSSHSEIAAKLRLANERKQQEMKKKENSAKLSSASNGGRKLLKWTPEEWHKYRQMPPFGNLMDPHLLPLRTPLATLYEVHMEQGEEDFTPSAIVEKLISQGRSGTVVNLGLVIDASGSDIYFHDRGEWDDWDVKYAKLSARLDEGVPSTHDEDAIVQEFCDRMQKHTSSSSDGERDVAVFAGRGYNLVGFLLVSYLVEYCNRNLDKALEEFAQSVAPGIYSYHYLERLYRKYHSTLPQGSTIACPSPPKWDMEVGQDNVAGKTIGPDVLTDQDKQVPFERKQRATPKTDAPEAATANVTGKTRSRSGSGHAPVPAYKPPSYKPPSYKPPSSESTDRPTKRRKIRSWVDDVAPLEFGETVPTSSDAYSEIVEAVQKLTGVQGFPGCEAIPLTATHVAAGAEARKGCLTKAYLSTWRARGRRCLLYVHTSGTYVVCRDMSLSKVNMHFPRKRAPLESQKNTLIDGVLVEDQDGNRKVPRFLAFDIVFHDGQPIWRTKLEKRLQCLQNEIILARKQDTTFDYTQEPFRVRMKDHFRIAKTEYLLDKFRKSVTHEVDGVIYTPTEAPYNLGGFESDEPIFKFVASEGVGIPGLDGSISQRQLLQYIDRISSKDGDATSKAKKAA